MKRALAALAVSLVTAPAVAQTAAPPLGTPAPAIEDLLAAGRLQEAAWASRAAGDTARGDRILARLDTILRSAPLRARPLGLDSQGVSYTFRLQHVEGIQAIFKVDGSDIFCPTCGAAREVAVYGIDRLLGLDLTPMTVFQTIDDDGTALRGSSMYFVHNASRPADVGRKKPDLLRFLDALIGNSDRHGANWLIRRDGSVAAIDHNRAFEYRPTTRPKTCWEIEVDSMAAPGRLGPAFDRYARLPADSLAAPMEGLLEPEMIERFVAMREKVVDRIRLRAARPDRPLPRKDCPWER